MKELTTTKIMSDLQFGGIIAIVVGIIFLIIGLCVLIPTIKRSMNNNKTKQNGEKLPKAEGIIMLMKSACFMFFFVVGVPMTLSGISQVSSAHNFTVSEEKVLAKDHEVQWIHRNKKADRSKDYYYLTFSEQGKNKVSKGKYEKYDEGSDIILVLNKKNKIIKMYDGTKYEYQAE